MSSAKDFVAGQCGGSNPLMKATEHLTKDHTFRSMSTPQQGHSSTDVLVNEFLQEGPHIQTIPQPSTFQMNELLQEINHLPQQQHQLDNAQPQHDDWVEDFNQISQQQHPWVDEMTDVHNVNDQQHQEEGWSDQFMNEEFHQQENWSNQFVQQSNGSNDLASEFLQENPHHTLEEAWSEAKQEVTEERTENVAKKFAHQLLNDNKMKNTNFAKYVSELGGVTSTNMNKWADDFLKKTLINKNWADEFDKFAKSQNLRERPWVEEFASQDDPFAEFAELMEKAKHKENELPAAPEKVYEFSDNNPFKDMSEAYEEGLKRIQLGDLANAVLLFEAAVQHNADHAQAWYQLGHAQAQNEQEENAIIALERTLSLEPNNLPAIMALAVSQTNESLQYEALKSLRRWILSNSKYEHLTRNIPNINDDSGHQAHSYYINISEEPLFEAVEQAFVEAARTSPHDPDCDVQCALGILFHLGGQFDKAVDCFRTAISVRPDDALLWNKLGATLANGSKSEEAVQAYRRALELNPGFTRSRYNLGISCINLKANREAVEHFLTALDSQRSARGPKGEIGQMSDTVWNTLCMTLSILKDDEGNQLAKYRKLDPLMNRYQVPMMKNIQ